MESINENYQTVGKSQLFKSLMILAISVFFLQGAYAQKIKIGPRISVGTSDIQPGDFLDADGQSPQELSIMLKDATPEYAVGGFFRVQLLGIYVQPELLFATSKVTYEENNQQTGSTDDRKERFYNLEIPVMAGTKLGPLRAQAGPVFRMDINSMSELVNVSGYGRNLQESSVGLRAGVGVDLGKKIIVDLTYEANLSAFANEVTIGGHSYELSNRKSQVTFSLGLAL
ncbi:MAG: PorT family protein [Bacteroidetes bacterium]|nr:PorT family protein [Bacteroidota bacterium]MCB0842203.1 PorT family protein [Bacteroidota bacterium]